MSICICSRCGNYTDLDLFHDNTIPQDILCGCADNPYYQEENGIQPFYTVKISNYYIKNHF